MITKNQPKHFPEGTRLAWEQAAREELQGADPWQKLSREFQGVSLRPYYSKEDAPKAPFSLAAADSGFHGPRTWYNCPRVIVSDPVDANAEALEHLQLGADGIFFELRGSQDFKKLLAKVDWTLCTLNFMPEAEAETAAKSLANYMDSFQGPARGAWYGKGYEQFPKNRAFHALGHFIPASATPIDTVAEHLGAVYSTVAKTPATPPQPVALRLEIGVDFFFEIARLRALRAAWEKLTGKRNPLHLHACSSPWTPEAYSPHANMLKATTAAMAAILGGADSVTVDPETHDNPMQRRVARNVGILLREESRFAKVADPLAGAYFIDHLTEDLASRIGSAVASRLRL